MRRESKKQVENGLFKGQKYKFEDYPEWYNDALASNRPIPPSKFHRNLDQAASFYQKQSRKLYFANSVLNIQLAAVFKEIDELNLMIADVEENENSSAEEKKKRMRRCANQIERKYVCPVLNCERSYGTEGSMAQHMRLKHPKVDYDMADLNPDPQPDQQQVNLAKEDKSTKRKQKGNC